MFGTSGLRNDTIDLTEVNLSLSPLFLFNYGEESSLDCNVKDGKDLRGHFIYVIILNFRTVNIKKIIKQRKKTVELVTPGPKRVNILFP